MMQTKFNIHQKFLAKSLTHALGLMVACSAFAHAYAQDAVTLEANAAQSINQESLPEVIGSALKDTGIASSDVSILVKEIDDKSYKINHLSDKPRTPASVQKIITTIIALDIMGGDYRWQTRVYRDGMVASGILYGNLIIKGSGDPSMTHDRLSALLQNLPKHGITHIKGDIIIDNLAFDGVTRDVNAFDGKGLRAYNAQPNAFLVNYGTLEVVMTPSGYYEATGNIAKDGQPEVRFVPSGDTSVAVQILPPLANFEAPATITGAVDGCKEEPNFSLTEAGLKISGALSVACGHQTVWLTHPNGDQFITKSVKGTWQQIDKNFAGNVRIKERFESFDRANLVMSYASKPLSEQIFDINQFSNNVMTEQVALSLPLYMGEAVSNYPKTFGLINSWWKSHLTTPAPVMSRASGLCRDCEVLPSSLADLLEFAYHQPYFGSFKNSLPLAGYSGTMRNFAKRNPNSLAAGRAYLKTGRLDNVASIAGYVEGKNGKTYIVVSIINADDVSKKASASKLLDTIIDWVANLS